MYTRSLHTFITTSIVLTALVLGAFGLLQWLGVPAGRFIDWIIGILSFWWLLVVVTVPWNIHFQAREVLADAAASAATGIPVRQDQVAYARTWVTRSLILAVALHLVSALALYGLAAAGISPVGYLGAGAALLLTGLRPAIRAYEYVAGRLASIRHELRYPRDDVAKLRSDADRLAQHVKALEAQLDSQQPHSWAGRQQAAVEELTKDLHRVRVAVEDLRTVNQAEHERLAREAKAAIAQITTDGQFLEHVREIIRFFKQA